MGRTMGSCHRATPLVESGWLYHATGAIPLDTPAWEAWRDQHQTFAYRQAGLTMTGRWSAERGRKPHWRGVRNVAGKLFVVRIGNHPTTETLAWAATELADRAGVSRRAPRLPDAAHASTVAVVS